VGESLLMGGYPSSMIPGLFGLQVRSMLC